jgi:hypothetical protein
MRTKMVKLVGGALMCASLMTSCYSYTSVVGDGAKGSQKVTKWNHYVIAGLVPVGVSDSKALAGSAKDYSVFTRMSFVNGLVGGITFGIYTPTTTTVTK